MKDLEFTCTQKSGKYEDGWDHPESLAEATDENGNVYSCCECDCDSDCCGCDNNNCGCSDSSDDSSNGNLVCSVFEKTCTTEESRGPSSLNDETGWHKVCTTSIRIIRKYQRNS